MIKKISIKIIELNEKKFRFYENEIKMLKEKIEQLLNLSKSNSIIESKKSKSSNRINNRNIGGSDLINKSITKLMNAVNDHIKEQNNDNQSILNKLMKEKELEFKNDQKYRTRRKRTKRGKKGNRRKKNY